MNNGPNLPLWNQVPHLTYWLQPSAVGIPLLPAALHRNTVPRAAAGARPSC